jgi:GTPase
LVCFIYLINREHVVEASSKIVTFLDLPGYRKYEKTTLSGLTGKFPDYSVFVISGTSCSISAQSIQHLGIAVGLKLPIIIIVTKIDLASTEQLTMTLKSLMTTLKSPFVRREPVVCGVMDDVLSCMHMLSSLAIVPILMISAVTGESIDLLTSILNLLPKAVKVDKRDEDVRFNIEECFGILMTL